MLTTLLAIVLGFALERARFGPSDQTALARVATEVQQQFASMGAELAAAAQSISPEPRGTGPDADAVRARTWFDRAAAQ